MNIKQLVAAILSGIVVVGAGYALLSGGLNDDQQKAVLGVISTILASWLPSVKDALD